MSVRIVLDHRHYGVHKDVSETEIAGEFSDYATLPPAPRVRTDEYAIDEDALLAALPEGFLPVPARHILLAVSDEDGGTGQSGLSEFRNWAKYFDAYTLNIYKPDAGAGR
jgi:hypothetical protein